jgi:leucine-rich melanocyte differentiation-associated protein
MYNRQIHNLHDFTNLTSLVLDNNELISQQTFPPIPSLNTLWVNNNNISDLEVFIESVVVAFPNITYLSMLKNPACPNQLIGKDQDQYRRYRYVYH